MLQNGYEVENGISEKYVLYILIYKTSHLQSLGKFNEKEFSLHIKGFSEYDTKEMGQGISLTELLTMQGIRNRNIDTNRVRTHEITVGCK